jgi:hypothetical protein
MKSFASEPENVQLGSSQVTCHLSKYVQREVKDVDFVKLDTWLLLRWVIAERVLPLVFAHFCAAKHRRFENF